MKPTIRQQRLDPLNLATVNAHQVGGDHYKTAIEHWDFVVACSLNYLEGNATKYLSRSHKKSGLQDLQKALHYVRKLIAVVEWERARGRFERLLNPKPELKPARQRNRQPLKWLDFCEVNTIPGELQDFVAVLANWADLDELHEAEAALSNHLADRFNVKV